MRIPQHVSPSIRLATGLASLLLLLGASGPVAPAQEGPPIRPEADSPQKAGATFWVEIRVGSRLTPVEDLFGTSFVLNYDASRLSVEDDEAGAFLGSDVVYQSDVDRSAGTVDVGVTRKSGAGGVSGNGVVARVQMTVADTVEGGSGLSFGLSDVTANDSSGAAIDLQTQALEVDVQPAPSIQPTPPKAVAKTDTFWVDVAVGNNDTPVEDLFGTSFVLDYDETRLSVVEDEAGPLMGSDAVYQSDVDESAGEVDVGVTRISGAGGVDGHGTVARVRLAASETVSLGTELPFSVREVSANDPNGDPLVLRSRTAAAEVGRAGPPIRPTTGSSEVGPRSTFWIDVMIGSDTEEVSDLFGTSFTLDFDADRVSVVEDEAGPLLGSDVVYQSNVDSTAGEIGIGVTRKDGAGGVSGSDVVARVRVQVEPSPVGEELDFSLSEVSARDSEGTSIALPPGRLTVFAEGTGQVVAVPDTYAVATDRTLNVGSPGVLANDDGPSLTATLVSDASEGELTFNDNGSFEYSPSSGFTGTDEFTYEAASGDSSEQATALIEVQEPTASASESVDASSAAGSKVQFGDTGTSVTFSGNTSGSGEVSVDRFDDPPPSTSGIDGNASEYRVEITASGDLSVGGGTEVRFDVDKLNGVTDPTAVTIYTRETPGSGKFTELETSYDAESNEVFADVSDFSEFAFGSQSETLFTYPEEVSVDVSRSFADASGPGDYRLVALPGQVDQPLAQTLSGEVGLDWQAYYDDGSSDNFLVKFTEADDGTFTLQPGNGFWVTATSDWAVEKTVSTVPLQNNDAITIDLRDGWNVISNPLEQAVEWATVEAANSGDLQPLWAFNGSFSQAQTFASATEGQAYYFYNDTDRESLRIPYPPAVGSKAGPRASSEAASMLALTATPAEGDVETESTVRVGLAEGAEQGVGPNDQVAPPARFAKASLRVKASGETASGRSSYLMTDQRPPASGTGGRTFELRLKRRVDGPVRLSASGLEAVQQREVALLHPSTGETYDLRTESSVTIASDGEVTTLKVAIGTEGYVDGKAEQVLPEEVQLTSYPNPIGQQGTIEYALPEETDVTLRIYDVLGRRVATLDQGRKEAGRHTVRLDTDQLSSGVYFGRLQADDRTLTKKITVVR